MWLCFRAEDRGAFRHDLVRRHPASASVFRLVVMAHGAGEGEAEGEGEGERRSYAPWPPEKKTPDVVLDTPPSAAYLANAGL
jgi:hypothetical protein